MKLRKLGLVLCLLALVCLCACADSGGGSGKPRVVASAFPEYDLVRAVAGERVELELLLKPGIEAHSYEPSPQDIVKLAGADLFVYGGGESDVWAERLLESGELGDGGTLAFMDYALLHAEETQTYMTVEEAAEEGAYDEHVWTSPRNAVRLVNAIRDTLIAIDPAGAEAYTANAADYVLRLEELDAAYRQLADESERSLLVFGDRFPFLYLTKEYGWDYAAAFPGCADAADANPTTVAFLIDLVTAEEIPVVFKCDLSTGKLADTIAEATGARVLTLYSCHTIPKAEFEAGLTCLDYMSKNLIAIQEALN